MFFKSALITLVHLYGGSKNNGFPVTGGVDAIALSASATDFDYHSIDVDAGVGSPRVLRGDNSTPKTKKVKSNLNGKVGAICNEYCKLYSKALQRCPYQVPEVYANPSSTCVSACVKTGFSKDDPYTSFDTDSIQCRMNHARMAIKEGGLTNSMHCVHSSLSGAQRCFQDEEAIKEKLLLESGRTVFYHPSLIQMQPSVIEKFQAIMAAITFLVGLRGRLYIEYPSETKYVEDYDCSAEDLRYRSPSGVCNSIGQPLMGKAGTSFTRNLKGSAPHKDGDADTSKVVNILKREEDSNKVAPFNQLVSAWIQFMTHDWFAHDKEETPSLSMRNRVTHWWDASQIYGSSVDEANSLKECGGKLHLDENGELDYNGNIPKTGFSDNFWAGLHVLHTIFAREHNYLVDAFSEMYPGMKDVEKYGAARNCIAAILAKIHTLEWTPTLLINEMSTIGLNINWYGVNEVVKSIFEPAAVPDTIQTLVDQFKVPHVINGDYPTELTMYDTPFFMTEEFVSVYRMHSLLPDEIEVDGEALSLQDLLNDARELVTERENTTESFLKSFAKTPARILSLKNYPYSLYNISLLNGEPSFNLAEIDILRDRERNIPRYNDARRQLLLQPYDSIDDLTSDEEERELLKSVYSDIEQVDFLVGCHVDQDRPEGFAFGIVPYYVFIVMASRRLLSDRFFMEGLTKENYTPLGLHYIVDTDFKDILERHFPDLVGKIPDNPFSNEWILD